MSICKRLHNNRPMCIESSTIKNKYMFKYIHPFQKLLSFLIPKQLLPNHFFRCLHHIVLLICMCTESNNVEFENYECMSRRSSSRLLWSLTFSIFSHSTNKLVENKRKVLNNTSHLKLIKWNIYICTWNCLKE